MKIAIEKDNKIKFFRIDGRKLDLFIKKADEVNGGLNEIWSYTHKRDGVFKGIKKIR